MVLIHSASRAAVAAVSCLALVLAAVLTVPVANADVIAAVDLPGPQTDSVGCPQQSDLALINAATPYRREHCARARNAAPHRIR
jgi:hypothetical protein